MFLGANDGASGTAVLMELAHLMPKLDSKYRRRLRALRRRGAGVRSRAAIRTSWAAHGSRGSMRAKPPAHKYRWGVLLDMVGDADLQIYQEQQSVTWRNTRPLVQSRFGPPPSDWASTNSSRASDTRCTDDHVPLRNIAKIPTCDIIDFDYPAWHTEADTPRRCSGTSLAKVGWVVYEWLQDGTMRVESRGSRVESQSRSGAEHDCRRHHFADACSGFPGC